MIVKVLQRDKINLNLVTHHLNIDIKVNNSNKINSYMILLKD
jgi:hypothetical protein